MAQKTEAAVKVPLATSSEEATEEPPAASNTQRLRRTSGREHKPKTFPGFVNIDLAHRPTKEKQKRKPLSPIPKTPNKNKNDNSDIANDNSQVTFSTPKTEQTEKFSTPRIDSSESIIIFDPNSTLNSILPRPEQPKPTTLNNEPERDGAPGLPKPRSPGPDLSQPPKETEPDSLYIPEKSLTEMLADNSQSETEDSIVPSLKTLVSASFLDNLPPTDPVQTIARLSSLLLTTEQDLQKSKQMQAEMKREMQTKQAEHIAMEIDIKKTQAEINKLQNDLTTLKKDKTSTPIKKVRYFRGWKNVLSTHHPCIIKIGENYFRSQEHAYCYEKLKRHGKNEEAEVVKKIRFAGRAKTYAHKAVPKPTEEWEKDKGTVMYDITVKRAQQSEKFRNALLATDDQELVHNMETDAKWGFGENGTGSNLMGRTLEKARDALRKGEIKPTSASATKPGTQEQTATNTTTPTTSTPTHEQGAEIIIISDSMLRDVDQHLTGKRVELHIEGGATTDQIRKSLGGILKDKKPHAVIVHCGTNDLEHSNITDMQLAYQHIINDVLFLTQGTKVLLSGMIHRLDKPELNNRMDIVNTFLKTQQTETVLYVDHNSTFVNLNSVLNRGGLHLRLPGLKQAATNLILTLAGQTPTVNTQKWAKKAWPEERTTEPQWSRPNPRRTANTSQRWQTREPLPLNNRFTPLDTNDRGGYRSTPQQGADLNRGRPANHRWNRHRSYNDQNPRPKINHRQGNPAWRSPRWQSGPSYAQQRWGPKPKPDRWEQQTTADQKFMQTENKDDQRQHPNPQWQPDADKQQSAHDANYQPESPPQMTKPVIDAGKGAQTISAELQALLASSLVHILQKNAQGGTNGSLEPALQTTCKQVPPPPKPQDEQNMQHVNSHIPAQQQPSPWALPPSMTYIGPQGTSVPQYDTGTMHPSWQPAMPRSWVNSPWGQW